MEDGMRWRPVYPADLPELAAIHAAALAVDGGSPFAADDWLLRRWYTDDVTVSLGAIRDGRLAGACAVRRPGPDAPGGPSKVAGVVDHRARGLGIGARLLDYGLAATAGPVLVETETLSPAADALFRSRGLRQVFAEDVMAMPVTDSLPGAPGSAGLTLTGWSAAIASRFYAVWHAAFAERPGFPDWSEPTWIDWISDDADFRPDWTLLASAGRSDVGFIVAASGGWIVQVGVVPAARGQRVSGFLIAEVLRRMRAGGEDRAVLNVNVNNPAAIAVYERIGFARIGRRARYGR